MGNGCQCPCNSQANKIDRSNTECQRSLTGEYSRQMDAAYLYTRENREIRAQAGIIPNNWVQAERNPTFENICNEKDNRFRQQTNPNAKYSRSVSPNERRFSSFDDNPNPREDSSPARSSPPSVKEIEFQLLKPAEESYDSFLHPIPSANVRGTNFDYNVNAVPKSRAEPMSGWPWGSRSDGRIKCNGGNMRNWAPLMETVENNSANDLKWENGETLNHINSINSVPVGSIPCVEKKSYPNRTIGKPNERDHQREMIATNKGNHWADSFDEASPQVALYQRKWSQQRERSSLVGTYMKPVISVHKQDHAIKCANLPTQATFQTKQKSRGSNQNASNDLSSANFEDPTYQFFTGLPDWEINFQTALDGCPRSGAEITTINNLSKSSMSHVKQNLYQPLSYGSLKKQPTLNSMYPNFNSSPLRRASKISSGSIDEKTQENYFAELDKDLASTPNYNHISILRSKLRKNWINSSAQRSESSKATGPADSFREMSAMGANYRNRIMDNELDMFLKRKASPNCSAMAKDVNEPNWYLEPDDSVKRPSSPGLKNMMQIFENTVANVQRSSFLVDHNIPLETYPFEHCNQFVDSQGDGKFSRLFGQECELEMFDRVQQRKFNSEGNKELCWQGDYEFISIGNPPGLSVRQTDKEFIRQVVTIINRRRPKFVVVCAQLIRNDGANWSISALKDGKRKEIKQSGAFNEIWNKIVRCIPLVFVRGNYNVGSNLSKARIKYNNEFQDNYFTFWGGGVKYIVLNSPIMQRLETSDELFLAHENWFNAELTRQHKRTPVHLVVFCSIPPFCFDVEEMNTNFNWPRKKRVIWLDKMVAANVKKIYCAQLERSFRQVYKGLEIVASASIGSKIFSKSIPNDCKRSKLKEVNSRLSFDASAINWSEEMCGLQIVKVSRNVLTERWLSVAMIKKSINPAKAPDNPSSHLTLSKFRMSSEFTPSACYADKKPTSELLSDVQRAPHINISDNSDRDNGPFQQPSEDGKDSARLLIKSGAKLNPPNLSYSCTHPAASKPSEAIAISQNSHQVGPLSISSKSTDDSKSNIATKLSKSSSQETEKFIFAKEAVVKNTQKSEEPWQFLPQQVTYSNKTNSPDSFGKDWTIMNLKTSNPHNEKKQNNRVYPTRNPRQSKMKLEAESKTQAVGKAYEKNKTAQSSKVAEWSVQDVLRWFTSLDPRLRKYYKVFINQRIDGRRLLVLKYCDLLYHFIQSREDVILIVSALEKLVPTPPEFGWVSKDGSNYHRFRINELMHIGEFSTTHQTFDLNNGNRICAMKLICKKKFKNHLRKKNPGKFIIREVALKMFFSKNPKKRHENMISFYEYCEKVSYRGAIYDYIVIREHHLYDLGLLTENRVPLGEDVSRRILHQLVSLLCFFREWKVGHFDLQPKNLLVQEDGWIIKVAGWSNYRQFTQIRYYTDAARHIENRSHYMAPELWERREYGLSADSWSVGALLYNMITGYLPFEHRDRADLAYNALMENNSEAFWKANMERTKGLIATTKSTLFNLLKFNARERLNIEKVKYEKYFRGIPLSDFEYGSCMKNHFTQLKRRLD